MNTSNHLSRFKIVVLAAALIFGGAGIASAKQAAPAADSGSSAPLYSDRGAQTCFKCHDEAPVTDVLSTPHGMKGDSHAPFGQHECESCHGPSETHVQGGKGPDGHKPHPNVVFVGPNASPVAERNKVCLSCHQNGLRMDWHGSQHQDANLACVSCHTIHAKKDPILVRETQPDKCFTCHAAQRALSMQLSHHPIREGKVICSDCHNPHGSPGPTLLKKVRVTDLCYTCHADKRGPMLWEHQPVREDCTNCHNPHGSVNPRLLKEKVPFLCLDCHAATNDMGGGGDSVHSVRTPGVSTFYIFGDRSCLNCHSQIHGSNSPSGSTFFR
jgi:DmsE family decaheme c-type cytochrome